MRVKETVPRKSLFSSDPVAESRKIGQTVETVARCLYRVSAAKRGKRRSSAWSVGGVGTGICLLCTTVDAAPSLTFV